MATYTSTDATIAADIIIGLQYARMMRRVLSVQEDTNYGSALHHRMTIMYKLHDVQ
jgi:hypothetical protein